MRLEVRLLGPLEVVVDSEPVRVTGRLAVVLAVLAMAAGRIASLDRLFAATWGEDLPDNPRASVHTLITRLRHLIGTDRIENHSAGYLLRAGPDEVDALRFADLLDRGLLAEALKLWRGIPFDGIRSTFLESQVPQLTERYLTASEQLIDLDLADGRHDGLVPQLHDLIGRYPLRESLWVRLLSVLDATGRRAEALEQYEAVRRQIADELGADPGPQLRAMHARLLAGDEPIESVPQIVPRQLPPDVAGFVGREDIMSIMDSQPDGETLVITAIGGTAGIGKTALAVHWAHRVAEKFPDGQLYANLRGFDPSGSPRAADEVLRGFLDALGVRPQRVPSGLEAQVGLYRSLLAGRRMLILLDNARDAEQIRPLLPGSPGNQVIVTSRDRLPGLVAVEGARPVVLDVLSTQEALRLLANRIGAQRVAADPIAIDHIIRSCARLPLALAIVSAQAALRPDIPLRTVADELGARLDAFANADPVSDVRVVFSWSYRTLTPGAAKLFRLLGLHPGPDIGMAAAASLAGVPLAAARTLLAELARVHLIGEHAQGRYTFHDLLRAYATELALAQESSDDRLAATQRMLDYYLHTALVAAHQLNPHRANPIAPIEPMPGAIVEEPSDMGRALAWFAGEHAVLRATIGLAADSGLDTHAWQLAWAFGGYLGRISQLEDWADLQHTALKIVERLGHRSAQAWAQRALARAYRQLGRFDEAQTHLHHALDLHAELGDSAGLAHTHHSIGQLYEMQGKFEAALGHAEQSLSLFRSVEDPAGEASALNAVGWCLGQLGDVEQALASCTDAVNLQQKIGDRYGEASTWDSLGYLHERLGDYPHAITCCLRGLALHREGGDRHSQAETLLQIADPYRASGDVQAAVRSLREAIVILDELHHPDADQARAKLEALER